MTVSIWMERFYDDGLCRWLKNDGYSMGKDSGRGRSWNKKYQRGIIMVKVILVGFVTWKILKIMSHMP